MRDEPVSSTSSALLGAIRAALTGSTGDPGRGAAPSAALATLSAREVAILQGLVAGKTGTVIAAELGVEARVAEVHRANIMSKTGPRAC